MATKRRQPKRQPVKLSPAEKDRLIRSFIVRFLDLSQSEQTVGREMLAELKGIKAQLAQFQLWEQDGYTSDESRSIRCAKRLRELMTNPPPASPKKSRRQAKPNAKRRRVAS